MNKTRPLGKSNTIGIRSKFVRNMQSKSPKNVLAIRSPAKKAKKSANADIADVAEYQQIGEEITPIDSKGAYQ